jgi:hypothetical protein
VEEYHNTSFSASVKKSRLKAAKEHKEHKELKEHRD